jgi:hypothetical protein
VFVDDLGLPRDPLAKEFERHVEFQRALEGRPFARVVAVLSPLGPLDIGLNCFHRLLDDRLSVDAELFGQGQELRIVKRGDRLDRNVLPDVGMLAEPAAQLITRRHRKLELLRLFVGAHGWNLFRRMLTGVDQLCSILRVDLAGALHHQLFSQGEHLWCVAVLADFAAAGVPM